MGVVPKPRRRAYPGAGDPLDLDAAILETLAQHGPLDALSLVSRVEGRPSTMAARMAELVVQGRVRISGGRFELGAAS